MTFLTLRLSIPPNVDFSPLIVTATVGVLWLKARDVSTFKPTKGSGISNMITSSSYGPRSNVVKELCFMGTLYCHNKPNLGFLRMIYFMNVLKKFSKHANSYLAVLLVESDFNIDIPHVQPSGRFSEVRY